MPNRKSDLRSRLLEAMSLVGASASDLADTCKISRAAVSKWLKGGAANLKNEHLFRVADYCQVDARWLGTGKGSARPSTSTQPDPRLALINGMPEMAIRLGRKWQSLDEPARGQVLMLVETLGALQNANYRKWGVEQQRVAKERTTKAET